MIFLLEIICCCRRENLFPGCHETIHLICSTYRNSQIVQHWRERSSDQNTLLTECFLDLCNRTARLDKEEIDTILTKIFEHQARLELSCRFTWTENTVCIWDNRSVIHFAIGDFYPGRGLGYERVMDRIAIEGDQPH